MNKSSALLFTCLLIGVTLVWGWTFPVVQDAVEGYGVLAFLAIRFTIAALAMLPLAGKHMARGSWKIGALIGLALAGGYLFQTWGIRHTTATNSGLITGLFIVFAPLWNRILFGVRTDKITVGAMVVSLLGLGLLTGSGPDPLTVGDLLTLGCAVSFGLHIALLDRFSRGHRSAALAIAQLTTCALIFAAIWPFVDPLELPSSASVWSALLLTGVVASAVGFWVQTAAQRRIPATRIAMILTMEPVFATYFGYALAGDRLGGVQIAGGVLMVAALLVSNIHQASRTEPESPDAT